MTNVKSTTTASTIQKNGDDVPGRPQAQADSTARYVSMIKTKVKILDSEIKTMAEGEQDFEKARHARNNFSPPPRALDPREQGAAAETRILLSTKYPCPWPAS
jgi:hypothetical protein